VRCVAGAARGLLEKRMRAVFCKLATNSEFSLLRVEIFLVVGIHAQNKQAWLLYTKGSAGPRVDFDNT
jgi:hypothetical protein